MNEKQSDPRERYLAGWDARMNHRDVDDRQSAIREHHLGVVWHWARALAWLLAPVSEVLLAAWQRVSALALPWAFAWALLLARP